MVTAAITACGGGSTDSQTSTNEAVTAVSAGAASSAETTPADVTTSGTQVTTNGAAVAAVTDPTQSSVTSSATVTGSDTSPTVPAEVESSPGTVVVAQGPAVAATVALAQGVAAPAVLAAVARPAGNTGTGFYVAGGKLYDANGKEFRIRGANRNHWDNGSNGFPLSGANTQRIVLSFTNSTSYNIGIINKEMLAYGIVPIPGNWNGTCKSDPASLSAIVDTWVAQASTWTALNSNGLINIANEWGPPNSTVWRDSYKTAIARMRAAGYTGTLVVDSGGCGQDPADVVQYGADVLASDPQKNILFDIHVYGNFVLNATVSWQTDYAKSMTALKATGLPIILGEFGPGRNIGPSPTMITPQQVIATAEAAGWGWMPWSWDDNNLANCGANDSSFSMTTSCGVYKTDADLTTYGKTVVPIIKATAVKASIFQ
jgi:mannan endo-1,4-beta-mannosidase